MCGISGFILNYLRITRVEAERILSEMCHTIRHRGPDDYGMYLSGFDLKSNKPTVGLGHTRLSIIDLSKAAHQPMPNENGKIWLSYNGEIYNFIKLKEELLAKGHKFLSHSDTEVIIHSYEEWGEDFVNKLNGMFAFALWDDNKNTLVMARDRMGKKPLFYSESEESFIFASEPKAILKFPNFEKILDKDSLNKYLLYEYVPSPNTIYKNIKRLEASSILLWKNGKVYSTKKYWNISFAKETPKNPYEMEHLLKDSVKMRLVSDVPLGVFLSGGIDSSAVTSLMTEIVPSRNIKTFTIGFEDKSFDESSYARELANYFNTDHHEKILKPGVMLDILPEIVNFLDEPFADASIIPTYLLSKFTREFVTVALGGDGGDELFAGYDTFQAHKLARFYEKIPNFIKKYLIENMVNKLPLSLDNMSFDFKLKQFLKGMPFEIPQRNQIWLGSFSPDEQKELLMEKGNPYDIFEDIKISLRDCNAENYIDLIIYLYLKFYLQDDILTKVDRASMACSLEVRAPFLDYRFVEYAAHLPVKYKIHGLTTKYILKKVMRNRIPAKIIKRPKKGFGVPIAKWINKDLKDLFLAELGYEKIKKEGLFNPSYVRNLLAEHFKLQKDNRKKLWTLLMFELWYSKWMKS